jgi:hypothetical protein
MTEVMPTEAKITEPPVSITERVNDFETVLFGI